MEWLLLPLLPAAAFCLVAAVTRAFPDLLRPLWRLHLFVWYRHRVVHADRVPATGPALLVGNHTNYLDWLILWASCPRPVHFVMWGGYYRQPVLRFLLGWVRDRAVRIENRNARPHDVVGALYEIAAALDAGKVILLYPEGRLTRTGQMLPFGRGLEVVLARTAREVPVIPFYVDGMWGSMVSHKGGRIIFKWPERFRRKITVWFGEPLPKTVTAAEARAAVVEVHADLTKAESGDVQFVPQWYIASAARWRRIFKPAFVDVATGTERILTSGQGLVAAWSLAAWLRSHLPRSDAPVGIWLPTGLGGTLANIALAFLHRPTVNLNYTAGPDANAAAAQQVGMTVVITSKRFDHKVPLTLPAHIERIYLEDALAGIGKPGKRLRFLAVLLLPNFVLTRLITRRPKPDDILTIVFSSGSTGEPKGVILTHRNIAGNGHAFARAANFLPTDRMLCTLPFFHSFGYTVCLWAPVGVGIPAVYYPDPRAAHEVGELCKKHACTIMLGTATFLRFYLRRSAVDSFRSLRLLICGAEKLPVKLAEEFAARFGVTPLEGYGFTEAAPVISTNLPDVTLKGVAQKCNTFGTVGQPIPGVVMKAFDPETRKPLPPGAEGLLGVKGPNVSPGYWGRPDLTAAAMHGEWFISGDRGLVEPDGFIRITGRVSRFAKIAGEMVPLERVEEELQDELGTHDRVVAVATVPDDKRGERVVVLHLKEVAAALPAALKALPKRGLPNLWVPDVRDCYEVDAFPVLGSGKLDLKRVADLALEKAR